MDREAWRAAVHGVTKNQTRQTHSSPGSGEHYFCTHIHSRAACPAHQPARARLSWEEHQIRAFSVQVSALPFPSSMTFSRFLMVSEPQFLHLFSSVQFSGSVMSDSLWPHGLQHARPPCPSPTSEFTQTHVLWVGDAIQPSHPLLSPSPPALNPSQRWLKYWSFSFNISPSNEHSGLISSRMDWLDLLAVQGTLKSLLQHHSSNASILRSWAFFTVQLSHPYMTTGKTIDLTRRTFVGKVMSLLLNMLSRLVITTAY